MKKLKKEEVAELVEECDKRLRVLERLFLCDFLDEDGDKVVANFFKKVKKLVEY